MKKIKINISNLSPKQIEEEIKKNEKIENEKR